MRTCQVALGILLLAAGLIAFGPPPCPAQSRPSRSLEQQLLEDLDANPLDPDLARETRGSEQKTPPGKSKPSEKGRGEPKTLDDLQPQLMRELGEAAVSEGDHPLVDVARQMHQVQGLLGLAETGEKTQQLQAGILASLDELLKAARNQKQQSSGAAGQAKSDAPRRTPDQAKAKPSAQGKPSTKPSETGKAQSGKSHPQRADMEEMREVLKNVWGELPEHEREQMLELPVEEFLPKYEWLIEAYFKRLAEEGER